MEWIWPVYLATILQALSLSKYMSGGRIRSLTSTVTVLPVILTAIQESSFSSSRVFRSNSRGFNALLYEPIFNPSSSRKSKISSEETVSFPTTSIVHTKFPKKAKIPKNSRIPTTSPTLLRYFLRHIGHPNRSSICICTPVFFAKGLSFL